MHSDSWTSSNGAAYNVHSQEVDLFAWLFQDFLPVFAAGNFGTQLYDGTISAPATAKNCLAVGVDPLMHALHWQQPQQYEHGHDQKVAPHCSLSTCRALDKRRELTAIGDCGCQALVSHVAILCRR